MDTREILEEAATRAENLAMIENVDSFMLSLGLEDDHVVHEFVTQQAYEIFKIRMFTGGPISIENCSAVSMLFGMVVGYQLALMREE